MYNNLYIPIYTVAAKWTFKGQKNVHSLKKFEKDVEYGQTQCSIKVTSVWGYGLTNWADGVAGMG